MCCFPASQICLVSWNWHWESCLWCFCLVFGDGENLFECLQFGGVFIVWLVVVCALGGSTKFIFRPRCAEWVPLHELSCRSLVYECRFLLERVLNKNAQDLGHRQFMFCRPCLSDTRCRKGWRIQCEQEEVWSWWVGLGRRRLPPSCIGACVICRLNASCNACTIEPHRSPDSVRPHCGFLETKIYLIIYRRLVVCS